jgi:hypothetical protein
VARVRSTISYRTLATIAAVYDAALDHSLWPVALAKLTQLTGSQASTFWLLDAGAKSLHPTFVSINFDQRVVDDYLSGIANLDPTVRYLLAHPKAEIVHDEMLGPGDDEGTREYMDWHERNVETRYRLAVQSHLGSNLQAGVALHRARRAGRYGSTDIGRLEVINEHLRRALAVGVKLGSLATQQRLTADLLDRNVSAIILLDASRRLVFMNRTAEELKAVGSRDPDVLHAQKQKLLAPSQNLKKVSFFVMVGGGLLTITVFAAFAGIPLALFGIWMWRSSSRNIATVEEAFNEFMASHPA